MKKFTNRLIAIGLFMCIVTQLTLQLKSKSNIDAVRFENELLGDFTSVVVEPTSNLSKCNNI